MKDNTLIILIWSIVLCTILPSHIVSSQIGKYCENDTNCADEHIQICVTNRCTCKSKYIANGIHCFPESHYGEACWFYEQCSDDREICAYTAGGIQRCTCDMYHQYDNDAQYCVPKHNITDLLQEKNDIEGHIAKKAESTFFGISIAGLLIACIGLCCFITAFIYCFRMHKSDKNLKKQVNVLMVKYGNKVGNLETKASEENEKKMKDAAVVPIIQDNMVLG